MISSFDSILRPSIALALPVELRIDIYTIDLFFNIKYLHLSGRLKLGLRSFPKVGFCINL